jgi:hypothetical protein
VIENYTYIFPLFQFECNGWIYQNSIAGCAAEILQTATEIVKQENSLSDSSDG